MTVVPTTIHDDNNISIHGQQDNFDNREQDSFRMLAFHMSERITEITDILRSTQCAIADLRRQIAILDNKVDKLSIEIWRRNAQ